MANFPTAPSFQDYATRYFNKKNPATNKIWTEAQIREDIIYTDPVIDQWFAIVRDVNAGVFDAEGRLANTEELMAAYNKLHEGQILIVTPFGLAYKKGGSDATDAEKLGDLSLGAAEVWLTEIVKNALKG